MRIAGVKFMKTPNFKVERGDWGMNVAERALVRRGFQILRRQWRYQKLAEIDFLVFRSDTSRFYIVEVKTHARALGDHHSIVSEEQLKRLRLASFAFKRLWHCGDIAIILLWVNPLNANVEFFENPC